jgi:L,D-transpeptidase catalytic domain
MSAMPARPPQTRPRRWIAAVAGLAGVVVVAATLVVVAVRPPAPLRPLAPMALDRLGPIGHPRPKPPVSPIAARSAIAQVDAGTPYSAAPDGPAVGTLPSGGFWLAVNHLPVLGQAPGWLEVRLPQRPNGSTGWIAASAAQLSTTTYGLLINVTTMRVELYDAGHVVADLPAGVGTPTDPTPLGQFYVMDVAPPPGPGWGPFVLDTNAHSEAITSWEGSGDAFTALHGPLGADAAIGTTGAAISHGCVRMHDADLAQLAPVPPGAPVVITA